MYPNTFECRATPAMNVSKYLRLEVSSSSSSTRSSSSSSKQYQQQHLRAGVGAVRREPLDAAAHVRVEAEGDGVQLHRVVLGCEAREL